MPTVVRITALRFKTKDKLDDNWKMTFDGVIDDEGGLLKQRYFGVSLEFDEFAQEWSFTLSHAPKQGFKFGEPEFDFVFEKTDIYEKKIEPGCVFSRFPNEKEKWLFQIVEIKPLN